MADVRCPVCDHVNSAGAAVCAFCGASLEGAVPLSADASGKGNSTQDTPPSDETDADAASPAADIPDWLLKIRERAQFNTDSPLAEDEPLASAEDDSDAAEEDHQDSGDELADADWLIRLRGDDALEKRDVHEADRQVDPEPAADAQEADSAVASQPVEPVQDEDDLAWLRFLNEDVDEPAQPPIASTADQSEFDLDAFLASLETPSTSPREEEENDPLALEDWELPLNQEELPEEINHSVDSGDAEAIHPYTFVNPEDAAANEDKDVEAVGVEQTNPEIIGDDALSDASPSAPEDAPAAPEEVELGETSEELPTVPAQDAEEPEPDGEEKYPYWEGSLAFDFSEPGSEEPENAQPSAPLEAVDQPPSEEAQNSEQNQILSGAAAPALSQNEEEVSDDDWLELLQRSAFAENEGAGAVEQTAENATDEETAQENEALPDWITSAYEPTFGPPVDLPLEPISDEEAPNVVEPSADLSEVALEQPAVDESVQETAESALFDQETGIRDTPEDIGPETVTKLLQSEGLEEPAPQDASGVAEEGVTRSLDNEDTPDWLKNFHSAQEETFTSAADEDATAPLHLPADDLTGKEPGDAENTFSFDLPDWLAQDAERESEFSEESPEPLDFSAPDRAMDEQMEEALSETDARLEQADLPEWVKEMRPIESVLPEKLGHSMDADQPVEKSGPLAGLQGILPAEDLVLRYHKPPVYSVKLRVSEKQRVQATLLDNLLLQEPQPLLIRPARSRRPGMLLRVLITLLLLAVITFPILPGVHLAPLRTPVLFPPELLDMFNVIDQTAAPEAVALVAFDYSPGLSGEMRLTASAVIEHLMQKNMRMVIVSTLPTGAALGDQLLRDVQQNHPDYDLMQRTVNLGYLPGGVISLAEFAQESRYAAPVTIDGSSPWQNTFLAPLTGIQNFSQVIVLTDQSEIGRAWVEQVQPLMDGQPLLVAASAQAAPLLLPYVESGQISGMVSGLVGGTMYAQRAGLASSSLTDGKLAAYQLGMLLAFVIILVGALSYSILSALKRNSKGEE